jgi:hypothetical protein
MHPTGIDKRQISSVVRLAVKAAGRPVPERERVPGAVALELVPVVAVPELVPVVAARERDLAVAVLELVPVVAARERDLAVAVLELVPVVAKLEHGPVGAVPELVPVGAARERDPVAVRLRTRLGIAAHPRGLRQLLAAEEDLAVEAAETMPEQAAIEAVTVWAAAG